MASKSHFIPNFDARSVLLLAALTVGTALAIHAQVSEPVVTPARIVTGTQDIDAAFDRADVNGDGKLDRAEAARFPVIEQRFDQIDRDRDQSVSREEFAAAIKT